MLLLAECYANKCFAEKLKRVLTESGIPIKVNHSTTYGRDRIVKKLLSYKEPHHVAGIIYYESGISRSYIDKHFDLEKVREGIFLGTARERRNVFAVIFDPHIEGALLCRKRRDVCKDPSYLRRVKSSGACIILGEILNSEEVEQLVRSIRRLLLEKIGYAKQ